MRLGRCAVLVSCVLTPTAALAALGDPQADLAVEVTATPDPVAPFAPVSYTVTVTNHGPDPSPDTSLTSLVDVGEVASVAPPCQDIGGGDVICALGTIPPGAQVSVAFSDFAFPTALSTVTNHSHVTGALGDPAPANNDAVVTATIATTSLRLELAHGTQVAGALLASEGVDGDFYRLRQQPHSSYEVVVDATSGDIIGMQGGALLERLAADAGTILQSAEAVGNGPSRTLRFANQSSTPIDHQLVRVRSGVFPPEGDAADVYHLRAFDTTYSVPRFNNVGTQGTVLLLQNPTSRPVWIAASFWTEGAACWPRTRRPPCLRTGCS